MPGLLWSTARAGFHSARLPGLCGGQQPGALRRARHPLTASPCLATIFCLSCLPLLVAEHCSECAAGKFCAVEGAAAVDTCSDCAAGKFSAARGATAVDTCSDCAAGKFSAAGASACTACEAGTYKAAAGVNIACDNCAAGKFSELTAQTSSAACTNCDAGKFQPTAGSSVCIDCEAGKFTIATGSTDCTECEPGKYKATGGTHLGGPAYNALSDTCQRCARDASVYKYGQDITKGCWECACGDGSQMCGCGGCPPISPLEGLINAECDSCAAGKYAAGTASTVCTDCTAGKYLTGTGSTTGSDCVDCPKGTYSGSVGMGSLEDCIDCSMGKYSTAAGATTIRTCTDCPAGKYASTAGNANISACLTCGGGTYSTPGLQSCLKCAEGKYSSIEAATVCLECPFGYTSPSGSAEVGACQICRAGFNEGPNGCTICPHGTYKDTLGTGSCIACPANSNSSTGSTSSSECVCHHGFERNGNECRTAFVFEMLDEDGDGQMTQKEYNRDFDLLDNDKDGFLSRAEFGNIRTTHFDLLDADKDGKLSRKEYEAGFALMDVDRNGLIDKREFNLSGRPCFLFSMLDIDGDGRITRNEYLARFNILDANGDGVITREEFNCEGRSFNKDVGGSGWDGFCASLENGRDDEYTAQWCAVYISYGMPPDMCWICASGAPFAMLDKDGDGFISKEWADGFDYFDSDKDGFISAKEFNSVAHPPVPATPAPAAGQSSPRAPDLDDLTFPEFKALLRYESYAEAGCAVKGGCFDVCLKGGLEVYDKPKGDTTDSSIYMLSKLENPPGSDCRCPPAFGKMNADNTTFAGFYIGEPLTLFARGHRVLAPRVNSTTQNSTSMYVSRLLDRLFGGCKQNSTAIYVSWAGCKYVYAVEESFDRDRDGKPDFLGAKGAVIDTIPPIIGTILANAITATVAATIFTNVATAVVEKLLGVLSTKDVQSLAQGIDPEVVGVTGGALVPLLQQAGNLGIIGQIGGQGSVPAVASRMSEGIAWVNFHLAALTSNTTDSAPAVQKRRNLVASRRRHMRRMGFRLEAANISEANKCAKVETSAKNLRSTLSSAAIAIGSAFTLRTRDHVKGILDLNDDDLIAQGRLTFMQFFGLTALTMPSITGVASKELAGSKETPTVMKSFMGLGESALEAAVSGCPKYLIGGIVLLVFLALFFLGIFYVTRPGGPVTDLTVYTRTGPQPIVFLDAEVPRHDNKEEEHSVVELLPGQTIEVVERAKPQSVATAAASASSMPRPPLPPPKGEQVTGSKFGAGVSMPAELTYADGGRARQTHVEMVTITIGGAAMGAEVGHQKDWTAARDCGEWIEEWVKIDQEPPTEKSRLEKEIADKQAEIDELERRIRAKKNANSNFKDDEESKKQIQDEVDKMAERLRNFPDLQFKFLENTKIEIQKSGADPPEVQKLEIRLKNLGSETGWEKEENEDGSWRPGKKIMFGAVEAQAMRLLVKQIDAEKENIGWTKKNPAGLDGSLQVGPGGKDESATLKLLREDLTSFVDAEGKPDWMKRLLALPMLPSIVKQWFINEILFYKSKQAKGKDPSKARGNEFVGPMSQFPNFGGYTPKADPAAQVCTSVQQGACYRVEAASESAGAALCRRLWGALVHCSRTRLQRKASTRSGTT